MTTIAYRDGVLAADTQASGGGFLSGYNLKATRRGRILAATVGACSLGRVFLDWVRRGMSGDSPKLKVGDEEAHGFIYLPDGRQVTFWESETVEVLMAPFFANGSGNLLALGAMEAGATAEEAVRAAMVWDNSTGGAITVLRREG